MNDQPINQKEYALYSRSAGVVEKVVSCMILDDAVSRAAELSMKPVEIDVYDVSSAAYPGVLLTRYYMGKEMPGEMQ
jgi:hypothetical protein